VGPRATKAASSRSLHFVRRSRFRKQSSRHHWVVYESATACRGVLRRREDRNTSFGSSGSVLPMSPGRVERHGFEYYRYGTLSLYAALNTMTGQVIGKTAERHTSEEFVSFLTDVVEQQPDRKEIHIIADNLSAHKTKRVQEFLNTHTNVRIHFTPTYSSWLNQVELWFDKIERDVIARGVFTSIPDLNRKLMKYIRQGNRNPKPIRWSYCDISKRIQPVSISMLQATSKTSLCKGDRGGAHFVTGRTC